MPTSYGPIQTFASGLLGFLQLKNRGKNPTTLLDEVRPVMDLTPWYMLGDIRTTTGALTAIATGSNIQQLFSGPVEENWYVHNISVWCPMGAGDQIDSAALTIIDPEVSAVHHPLPGGIFNGPPAIGPNNGFFLAAGGFWLPSGQSLGLLAYSSLAGSTFGGTFQMRWTPAFI